LLRGVKASRSTPLSDLTNTFNQSRNRSVSRRTVQRVLFQSGYHRWVIRKVIRIKHQNKRNRVAWCRGKRFLPVTGYWNKVIFSDESKVDIGTDNRLYVWRRAGEEWMPQCTAPPPRKKFGVMIWGCLTFNGVGTLAFINGTINAKKYEEVMNERQFVASCCMAFSLRELYFAR